MSDEVHAITALGKHVPEQRCVANPVVSIAIVRARASRSTLVACLKLVLAIGFFGAVSACTRMPEPAAYLEEKSVTPPRPDRFTICHGYDCTYRSEVKLVPEDWERVRALFEPPSASAAEERQVIAASVALMERIVGARVGTKSDVGGIAFIAAGNASQLDCIDESVNTTVYLLLMREDGLLRWHDVAPPASRGVFLDGRWYHQSAVIRERDSEQEYAVDSWVNDNGAVPVLTELGVWQTTYGGAVDG